MKKLILCALLLLAFGIHNLAAQSTKVGIVDADAIIQQSAKGKAFFDEYQRFTNSKRDEINRLVEDYRAKEKDAQAKAASLTEEKRQEIASELQRMQTDIKRKQEDAKRESQMKLNEKLETFQRELAPLIRQVAIEMGLDLVLNYGPQSSIVYFSDAINITDDVIRKYDERR